MRSTEFIQTITQVLKEFLQSEISQIVPSTQFEFFTVIPHSDRNKSSQRSGIFGQLFGSGPFKVYLLPYLVQRSQAGRNSQRIPSSIYENGQRISVSKKAPELYRIRYAVTGLPLGIPEGQTLLSALISIFFDHSQVQFDSSTGLEALKILELSNQDDPFAGRVLSNSFMGPEGNPLYLFEVEVEIQTDTILEKTKFVQSRNIQLSQPITANKKMEEL